MKDQRKFENKMPRHQRNSPIIYVSMYFETNQGPNKLTSQIWSTDHHLKATEL